MYTKTLSRHCAPFWPKGALFGFCFVTFVLRLLGCPPLPAPPLLPSVCLCARLLKLVLMPQLT